jgi:hypothetical protein
MLVKNKNDNDYTEIVKSVYHLLSNEFGYLARISDIWLLLARSFNIKEFELIDTRQYQNGQFESYLIDRLIDWKHGKDVNFSEITDAIKTVGDFTSSEKLMFEHGNIDERLWAIYLLIDSPELKI